jgi:uncharacterized Zn-finger protein
VNKVTNSHPLFQISKEGESMFDFDALCPHCEGKFKLSMIGLETKEFIQCPLCRRIIKLDLADPEKKAIRIVPDFAR